MSETATAAPAGTLLAEQPQAQDGKGDPATRRARLMGRLAPAAEIALVLIASAAFAASFGLNYGVNNQVTYLIPSLQVLDPELYKNDWFAEHTTHIHPGYKYLGAILIAVSERGWGIALGLLAVVTAGTVSLYSLLRVLAGPRSAFPGFLLLLSLMFVTRTAGPAMSYVFDGIFQPSTLGSAAFLGSVPFFVRQKYLVSGALLALCGVFHANLLLLFGGAYALAHCLLGRQELRRRLLLQFVLPAAVMLLLLPMLLSVSGGLTAEEAARARQIIFDVRAPHHFVIRNQWRDFIPLVAWLAIALGLGLWRGVGDARRLLALSLGMFAVIAVGVVASVAFGMYQVTVLFPWRIVPHCEVLFQCLAAASVLSLMVEGSQAPRLRIAAVPLLIAGLGLLFYRDDKHLANLTLVVALIAALVMVIRTRAHRWAKLARRHGAWLVTALAALALYEAARSPLKSIRQRSNVFEGLPRAETELYAWMQTTPKGAVFLTPPTIETMRLHGKRAIVADWKSSPASPAEIFEWYRRLEDVSGHANWRNERDLRDYDAMDAARLGMLRDRYGIDYAVLRRGSEHALSAYKKCFENQAFIVIEVALGS